MELFLVIFKQCGESFQNQNSWIMFEKRSDDDFHSSGLFYKQSPPDEKRKRGGEKVPPTESLSHLLLLSSSNARKSSAGGPTVWNSRWKSNVPSPHNHISAYLSRSTLTKINL